MRQWIRNNLAEWLFVMTLLDLTMLAYIAYRMHP